MRSEQVMAFLVMLYLVICLLAPVAKLIGLLSISWGLLATLYIPLILFLTAMGALCLYVFNTNEGK